MRGYDATTYGDAFADVYDRWYEDVTDVDATTAAIAGLAGNGSILELGVGTGRLALPLARAGFEVHGIDASQAMLDRLRGRVGADDLQLWEGDMSRRLPDGPFSVVFVAYNTLFNLTEKGAQQRCIELVAGVLDDGGCFVVEAFVPGDRSIDGSTRRGVEVKRSGGASVLNVTIERGGSGLVEGVQVELRDEGPHLRPWSVRYLDPGELDALAEGAGLSLWARWADWDGARFDSDSTRHVSIYRSRQAGQG